MFYVFIYVRNCQFPLCVSQHSLHLTVVFSKPEQNEAQVHDNFNWAYLSMGLQCSLSAASPRLMCILFTEASMWTMVDWYTQWEPAWGALRSLEWLHRAILLLPESHRKCCAPLPGCEGRGLEMSADTKPKHPLSLFSVSSFLLAQGSLYPPGLTKVPAIQSNTIWTLSTAAWTVALGGPVSSDLVVSSHTCISDPMTST